MQGNNRDLPYATQDEKAKQWLRVEQYLMVCGNIRSNTFALPLFAAVLAWVFAHWVTVEAVVLWTISILVLSFASVALDIWQKQNSVDIRNVDRWISARVIQSFACNVAWVSPALFFWDYFDEVGKLLLILIYACSMSGAVALASPCPRWVAALLVPLSAAIIFPPLFVDNWVYQSISVLAVGFSCFMAHLAYLQYCITRDVLLLRDQKSHWVEELSSALKTAEAARLRAEQASRAKSNFLANMSHELRTPLNAVIGFSDMIKSRVWGDAALDRYVGYADNINSSGQHLLALINDILDLAKIEAGKLELNETTVSIGALVSEALLLISPQAGKKRVRVLFEAPNDHWLHADERALKQILANLLSNAVKFTQSGGSVVIDLSVLACGTIKLSVMDTGVGIAPRDLARVMEKFGQGRHDVTPAGEQGTGLGLPIVRGLIEAHEGRLEITSKLGVGTTATVLLPASRLRHTPAIAETRQTA